MKRSNSIWPEQALALDVRFGYLSRTTPGPRVYHPQVVVNEGGTSVLRSLREELRRSRTFTFSVAFVTPRAIALLKQELLDFSGQGRIITSDYLAFNTPRVFAELLNLTRFGLDVRVHRASAFHPKGYIFEDEDRITALVGSANLTENALVRNHEWNVKVSAARESDLAAQVERLIERELAESDPLTQEWLNEYALHYIAPPMPRTPRGSVSHASPAPPLPLTLPEAPPSLPDPPSTLPPALSAPDQFAEVHILPNRMQRDALKALKLVRDEGKTRAIVISATGTGKTMLSAFDVKAAQPNRLLFVVHREQILDRTIQEYQRVLDAPASAFGKLTGGTKQVERRFLFATIQTLSQPHVLHSFEAESFDYIIVDEAHRVGAPTYQRVLKYFRPRFLLGMTATPERTDGFNVFEVFDYNVPYEIRLNHALEEEMLSPFHYYGISEIEYDDGTTVSESTELKLLISPARIDHLLEAIEAYGQAGMAPRGLIFCSRKHEAKQLSEALNQRTLRGKPLRTVALTGEDDTSRRLAMVDKLEAGELDYILTVDVFNEGVDIPSVNQVIMLRQTQSPIVFVQQLGRGLRKAEGKDYLVVIDFIGNYTNNFMIPIALFGDESLNRESLRKNLIAAEESGVLPGLSSVRFDKIAQERVLSSIATTRLDSLERLKAAVVAMRNRVGGPPALWDFWRFESVDPVLLATNREHYPALLRSFLKIETGLDERESRALRLLSHEVLTSTRLHEFVICEALFRTGSLNLKSAKSLLLECGTHAEDRELESAMDTLTLNEFAEVDWKRYGSGVAERGENGQITLQPDVRAAYTRNGAFRRAVDDLLKTGSAIAKDRYGGASRFIPGLQYSRREACRILNWPRRWSQTIYGYRTDHETKTCPIFVTLHKSNEITASTAYEDELLNRHTMRWFTRSRRTLKSEEVRAIVANEVALHVFVKKDDAEGIDFYYLGEATSYGAKETTMKNDEGKELPVVEMLLHFEEPIDVALYDYFHPALTN